jgi:hypothetical protein
MYMKKTRKKFFRQKNQLLLLLLLTVILCKQRYARTSLALPSNVTVSGFKIIFSIYKASKFSIMQD